MNQLQQQKPKTRPQSHGQVNPFARALAETEQSEDAQVPTQATGLDAFRQALQKAHGSSDDSIFGDQFPNFSQEDLEKQQAEFKKQQERAALRRKLHEQINQIDTRALFDARDKREKEQIEQLKKELKALTKEVSEFNKDVELTLMTQTTDPGERGSYFTNFFLQLRSYVLLLRQRVSSARTWLQGFKGKQSKKPGMQIKGQGFQKTSTVQNMMHHERSSSYAGA